MAKATRAPLAIVGAVTLAGSLLLGVGGERAAALPAAQRAELGAAVFRGNCVRHDDEAAFALASPAKPAGEGVRGLPAVSETQVTTTLAALQSERHIVLVFVGTPEVAVACGDIHTITGADGSTLATGLVEQNSSLYTGVAVLQAAGGVIDVRLYVSRALNGGFGVSGGAAEAAEVTNAVEVVLDDDEIAIEQTEFTVGSTVEFVARNLGTERHELVLEEVDALEVPLEIDDKTQAETEDIAPDGEASFVYTFDESGTFQLADHISNNYQRGMVIEIVVTD